MLFKFHTENNFDNEENTREDKDEFNSITVALALFLSGCTAKTPVQKKLRTPIHRKISKTCPPISPDLMT